MLLLFEVLLSLLLAGLARQLRQQLLGLPCSNQEDRVCCVVWETVQTVFERAQIQAGGRCQALAASPAPSHVCCAMVGWWGAGSWQPWPSESEASHRDTLTCHQTALMYPPARHARRCSLSTSGHTKRLHSSSSTWERSLRAADMAP